MNKNSFRLLEADIQVELDNLKRLIKESEEIFHSLKEYPTTIELRAMGSILHDFYCGVERIFERIAIDLDGEIPKGEDWHTRILTRMKTPIKEVRPSVISQELQSQLKDYLRFRHLFRNVYGFELKWDKLNGLVQSLPETYGKFEKEISLFFDFLNSLHKNVHS